MDHQKAVLVFNPGSGKGKGKLRAEDFANHWRQKFGSEIRLRATVSKEDIRVAARETHSDEEIQIFMGGDGTLSESVQGLAEHRDFDLGSKAVGFLPGGTGNSFLRDFGITNYEEGRDALIRALEENSVHDIDSAVIRYRSPDPDRPEASGEETRRIMFNIFGVGLISDITEMAVKMRSLGSANYTVASLVRILSHRPYRVKAVIDGENHELKCNLITVSNSCYTGGAMKIAPETRCVDGKLFYIVMNARNRFELFHLFPKILRGDHLDDPRVRTGFIQRLELEQDRPFLMKIDGEVELGYNPQLDIRSSFFRLYLPGDALV